MNTPAQRGYGCGSRRGRFCAECAGSCICCLVCRRCCWGLANPDVAERQLADQARFKAKTLKELAFASSSQQRSEFDKRYTVEQRLQINDQTHQRALIDAKQRQARPMDRLATADLRLSVILAQPPFAGGNAVSAATGTGGVVYGGERAELDRAFAQRIVRITEEGMRG